MFSQLFCGQGDMIILFPLKGQDFFLSSQCDLAVSFQGLIRFPRAILRITHGQGARCSALNVSGHRRNAATH